MYTSVISATDYITNQLGYFYDSDFINKDPIANMILDDVITDLIKHNNMTDTIADQCEATEGDRIKIDQILQTILVYQSALQTAVNCYCSWMISIHDFIVNQGEDKNHS